MKEREYRTMNLWGAALVIPSMPLAAIWKGFVIVKLWEWFAMPQFGLAPMRVPVAIGLSCLIAILCFQYRKPNNNEDKTEEKKFETLLSAYSWAFLLPAYELLIGYICHHWF